MALPRNALVSAVATGAEVLVIPLLVELAGLHYVIAVALAMLLATTISFFLNKHWVFEARRGNAPAQYGRQLVVAAATFGANLGLTWVLTEQLGVHYLVSFVAATTAVFVAWSYPASRWLVFWDGYGAAPAAEPEPGG